jgi:8-amino-7-oxononanoate synthase
VNWLAERAAERAEAGLERTLGYRDETLIDLSGNDYLGLSRDDRLTAAAATAARTWGAGAGASRLVSGSLRVHEDLERALAAWVGTESALVHSTGYHANLSAVTALSDADTLVVSDAHIHASLIDACRLSRGRVEVVPHSDVAAVERALDSRAESRALVIVESIYSVLGDRAPLAELAALCQRQDATLIVDEAHGLGVIGDGHGLVHELGLGSRDDVVVTVTLSKALGSQGGAVLGSQRVVDHLVNTARPFIFDTGLAPASAAAALAGLQVVKSDPGLVSRVNAVAAAIAQACGAPIPRGAVLSVPMPSPEAALQAQRRCAAAGVRVGAFRPPSVPDGISRLRLTASARVTDRELDHACTVLREVLR